MTDIQGRLSAALVNRYDVKHQIGQGGMATVFLAHDVKHDRDVAIKVLHPDLAAALGAERFLAEIKTTARLQHPHILPLLDSGEADGLLFYVMPFVSGESLRTRLERETQLSVDDATRIAREVASALDSAHRAGVVHRDIKPENILIHEDQALVADFGIALAVSAAGGSRMTQTGLSLGTPAYMAPEQAMGEKSIDARADIYALGAVLYESLVGEPPFTGPSVQAIVARVMNEQPRSITAQRRSVPPHVDAVVLKALEKLPADRFASAAEFSRALSTPGFETGRSSERDAASGWKKRRVSISDVLPWTIAAAAAFIAVLSIVRRAAQEQSTPLMHLTVAIPADAEVDPFNGANLDISEDGRRIAFAMTRGARREIVLRDLSSDSLRNIAGTVGSFGSTEFSPDGEWIAFNGGDNDLLKVRVAGGAVTRLGKSRWAQIGWVGNETIIYTENYDTGLTRVSADGKDTATLTTPDRSKGELGHWWPQALPDGKHIVFTNYRTPADKSSVEVLNIETRERKVVIESGFHARYSSDHLLFGRTDALYAIPFDAGNRRVTGEAVPLPLSVTTVTQNGWTGFAVSRNKMLLYLHDPKSPRELAWVDEGGVEEATEAAPGNYIEARPSPDGRKIAVVRDGDVWVFDPGRRLYTRLTRTEQVEGGLIWSPDSRYVFYVRDVPIFDIYRRIADASAPEEQVVASDSDKAPTSISPDGRTLLFDHDDKNNSIDAIELGGGGTPRKLIDGAGNDERAVFSPDGNWIAYNSDESGRQEVYLVPASGTRDVQRQQISIDGGGGPEWGPDGRTVYFRRGGQLTRVRVNPRTGEIGSPEPLSRISQFDFWSIAPDGRLLIGKQAKGSERPSLRIVTDWTALLPARKN
jgi:serine/threonine protein kinase/Tol biopolymer transport system component